MVNLGDHTEHSKPLSTHHGSLCLIQDPDLYSSAVHTTYRNQSWLPSHQLWQSAPSQGWYYLNTVVLLSQSTDKLFVRLSAVTSLWEKEIDKFTVMSDLLYCFVVGMYCMQVLCLNYDTMQTTLTFSEIKIVHYFCQFISLHVPLLFSPKRSLIDINKLKITVKVYKAGEISVIDKVFLLKTTLQMYSNLIIASL